MSRFQSKPAKSYFGTGIISLAVVLVVLTITCFAILAYASVQSEYELSTKSAKSVQAYYRADGAACEKKAQIRQAIKENRLTVYVKNNPSITMNKKEQTLSYQEAIGKTKGLKVKLSYENNELRVLQWQVIIRTEQ